mgnify:CR=1 FL=1|tara:strand:+ start:14034 stop:14327 length:294 start_codon:yes stop_codon:yes gene_type:complete
MTFGASSFAETCFAEVGGADVTVVSGRFVIFPLNASTLKKPIRINTLSDFSLNFSTTQEFLSLPLKINTLSDFNLTVNLEQDHTVKINKVTEYNLRR